ncbi:MAG: Fe-S cluster assembly protein SufD [Candidatus Omnitrophica bacterium]|nr:Fe-S cluster assembly protein SufD [Candidatus Omnitrophota bacterium]
MAETFDTATIEQLAKRLNEPAWMTQMRRDAFQRHGELPWPHPSDEIWRRTDASLFDPLHGFALGEDQGVLSRIALSDAQYARDAAPMAGEDLLLRADGSWVTHGVPAGVSIEDLSHAAPDHAARIRAAIEADGITVPEQKLTSLNVAFHHDDLFLHIAPQQRLAKPLRVVHLFSVQPQRALFPLTVIVIGRGSSVVLIDEYVGVSGAAAGVQAPHVINGRIELIVEPQAQVHYVRIQRWEASAREFLLQRATLQEGAQFTMVNINLGASLSKAHVITQLMGEHASSQLYGFIFGHGRQHIDQHTLQDHQAPHTTSDLLFRAALKDASRMVYTGLIRIAKSAKQSEAFQANHNLLLSQQAKAETIPMLEILADDVRCKHAATAGPIDEEQAFYLMTRGLPRDLAERLIVMGFVEQIIRQVPFEPLQERLREELEGNLQT